MSPQQSPALDLIIFDADGVLVDSEPIAIAVLASAARSAGAAISDADAVSLFRGLKMSACVEEIERRAGKPIPLNFVEDVRSATASAFEGKLKPIRGVRSALAAITVPVCVASNGPREKLTQTLRLTGLHRRFGENVFSAYEVGSWKPDPGLFLHAASQFQADPRRCLVIEDSLPGVRAAGAAGMRAFGYAGGDRTVAKVLRAAGAIVFHDMTKLPDLIRTHIDL